MPIFSLAFVKWEKKNLPPKWILQIRLKILLRYLFHSLFSPIIHNIINIHSVDDCFLVRVCVLSLPITP